MYNFDRSTLVGSAASARARARAQSPERNVWLLTRRAFLCSVSFCNDEFRLPSFSLFPVRKRAEGEARGCARKMARWEQTEQSRFLSSRDVLATASSRDILRCGSLNLYGIERILEALEANPRVTLIARIESIRGSHGEYLSPCIILEVRPRSPF